MVGCENGGCKFGAMSWRQRETAYSSTHFQSLVHFILEPSKTASRNIPFPPSHNDPLLAYTPAVAVRPDVQRVRRRRRVVLSAHSTSFRLSLRPRRHQLVNSQSVPVLSRFQFASASDAGRYSTRLVEPQSHSDNTLQPILFSSFILTPVLYFSPCFQLPSFKILKVSFSPTSLRCLQNGNRIANASP